MFYHVHSNVTLLGRRVKFHLKDFNRPELGKPTEVDQSQGRFGQLEESFIILLYPYHTMYGMFTYIYHKNQRTVGKYSIKINQM